MFPKLGLQDFPKSWSDQPTCENKSECATPDAAWPATMTCALNTTTGTADYKTATATIDRLCGNPII